MTERQSKYYNDNAEEAVKRYRQRLKGINLIYYFLLAADGLWILSGDTVPLFCNYILLLFFIGIYTLVYRMQFPLLANVLLVDCDPVKFFDILTILEGYDKKGKAENSLLYCKAACCCYMNNRVEEGMSYLKNIQFKKKKLVREASILSMSAHYAELRNDRESFNLVKKDLENLPNVISHKENDKKQYDHIYKIFRVTELIWDEKDEEARRLIEELLQVPKIPILDKVFYHMYLARLDRKADDKENAKRHLDYVITHGNKVSVVEEAKQLIKDCC